ncbi:hypothetical protein Q9233_003200 [Columba guinea]|nr:hypothetical protein Q9233_003200 [Columba guinea]
MEDQTLSGGTMVNPSPSHTGMLQFMVGAVTVDGNTGRFWTEDVSTAIHYQINSESALTWHQARKSYQQQNAELLSITEIREQEYMGDSIFSLTQSLSLLPGKMCGVMNLSKKAECENQACNQRLGTFVKRETSVQSLILYPEIYAKLRVKSYVTYLFVSFDQKLSWLDETPMNYAAWAPNEQNFANNDKNFDNVKTFSQVLKAVENKFSWRQLWVLDISWVYRKDASMETGSVQISLLYLAQ